MCNRHQMGAGKLITFPLLYLCASLYHKNMLGTVLHVNVPAGKYMVMLLGQPQDSLESCHPPKRVHRKSGQGQCWVGRAGGKQRQKLFLPDKALSELCSHKGMDICVPPG